MSLMTSVYKFIINMRISVYFFITGMFKNRNNPYSIEFSGILTYMAADGEKPNQRQFIAPKVEQLVLIAGRKKA